MNKMLLSTTDFIPGEQITKILGIVKGNTVRCRWFGRDIAAGFRQIVGGEIKCYTEMLSAARKEATERMIREAEELGADAVINMRYVSGQIMQNAAEILVYGTAVKLKNKGRQ